MKYFVIPVLAALATPAFAQQLPAPPPSPSPDQQAYQIMYGREVGAHQRDLAMAVDLSTKLQTSSKEKADIQEKLDAATKEIADLKAKIPAEPVAAPKTP